MKHPDVIVVGSGITGLTLARLLAMRGAKVLVLEQAAQPGGLLARFTRRGVPFDVGFHFTGGFSPDGEGILDEMLTELGVRDMVSPIYHPPEANHHILIPTHQVKYTVPGGLTGLQTALIRDFPAERPGLERFFARFREVIAHTPTMRLAGFDQTPPFLEEDGITLQDVLEQNVTAPLARTILGGFCMCYGCRPDQISFANHCRMTYGLHHALAKLPAGGQTLVDAMLTALADSNVEIRCRAELVAVADVAGRRVRRFRLADGTEIAGGECILTIHPERILELLRPAGVSKAFQERVSDFALSPGFFAMFGVMRSASDNPAMPVVSILPEMDLNAMLTCQTATPVDGPLVLFRNHERNAAGETVETVTILELGFPEWMKPWADSRPGARSAAYERYKRGREAAIMRRVTACFPEFRDGFECHGSSSLLTFRDHLAMPGGAAYGIRQQVGQFNLVGRLPFANLHAAGQCAILPGVVGAMTSAFLIARTITSRQHPFPGENVNG